jgi:AraC-like DNA-binding protein
MSISLQNIAESSCYSPVHFQAIFSENMGETFSEYVLRNRLFLAERRLIETHEKLNDLAALAGFSSQANFTRAFKQWFDLSPARYRRQYFGDKRPPSVKSKIKRRTSSAPKVEYYPHCSLLGCSAKGFMSAQYDHTLWAAMGQLCDIVLASKGAIPLSSKPIYLALDIMDLTRLEDGIKMAAVQVDKSLVSPELTPYIYDFSGGLYATFSHQGLLPEQTLNIAMFDWLSISDYSFDWTRPVFMGSGELSLDSFTRNRAKRSLELRECVFSDGLGMSVSEIEMVQIDISLPILVKSESRL